MAYSPPVSGGLRITDTKGNNIGIWMDVSDEGVIGDIFIAARLDPTNGWLAFWQSDAQAPPNWQTAVTAAGGIVPLITTYLPAINSALATLEAPAAPVTPTTSYSADEWNAALAASFTLTLVNGVPVLAAVPTA